MLYGLLVRTIHSYFAKTSVNNTSILITIRTPYGWWEISILLGWTVHSTDLIKFPSSCDESSTLCT